jgi:pyruvate/2-oxoglutarate dehydrogenase complex dihydrolipoamide acyltransferase (E2) component
MASPFLQAEHVDVKVPQMGESVSEGTVAAILKKPGTISGA